MQHSFSLHISKVGRPPHGGRGLKYHPASRSRSCPCRPPHGGRGLKSFSACSSDTSALSPPTRGAWIEIDNPASHAPLCGSPPTRGAWIEISIGNWHSWRRTRRPPHGGRGLKFNGGQDVPVGHRSPPTRGAWIEIDVQRGPERQRDGSPPTRGAWIEMSETTTACGLHRVAPHTGGVD